MHFNFLKTSRVVKKKKQKKHKILNMHSSEDVTVLYECIDVHVYKKIKVLKRISKLSSLSELPGPTMTKPKSHNVDK